MGTRRYARGVQRFRGSRVYITGGTSGIGAAAAARFVAEGARVVVSGRSRERGEAVAKELGCGFVEVDVRDDAANRRGVEFAVAELGGLDVCFLNAGILDESYLVHTTDDAWDAIIETNVVAVHVGAQAAAPHLVAPQGSLIVTGSDAGIVNETWIGAYSVSKRTVHMLVQMLALELAPAGVRVNAVCPGDTLPGMRTLVTGSGELMDTSAWRPAPIGRIADGDDIAGVVAFLASPDARHITGALTLVDGGARAGLRATEPLG